MGTSGHNNRIAKLPGSAMACHATAYVFAKTNSLVLIEEDGQLSFPSRLSLRRDMYYTFIRGKQVD